MKLLAHQIPFNLREIPLAPGTPVMAPMRIPITHAGDRVTGWTECLMAGKIETRPGRGTRDALGHYLVKFPHDLVTLAHESEITTA